MEEAYPFRFWLLDTVMWSMATDVAEERQGPAVVLRLGGIARSIAREVPPEIIARGAMIDLGDGVEHIIALSHFRAEIVTKPSGRFGAGAPDLLFLVLRHHAGPVE